MSKCSNKYVTKSITFSNDSYLSQISYEYIYNDKIEEYENIQLKNNPRLYLEKFLDDFYDLLEQYINVMNMKLKKNNKNIWDTDEIKQISEEIKVSIREKYIDNQSSSWKFKLISIFNDIFKKLQLAFSQVDEIYEDELDQCEELYNLLDCMFPNIEEIVMIKFKKSKNSIDNIYLDKNEYIITQNIIAA